MDSRPDRLQQFQNHVEYTGLKYERFRALPHIGPHQSFNFSMLAILAEFWHSGKPTILILEDDCQFQNIDKISAALRQLPSDWDMVYFGANIQDGKFERYSNNLVKIGCAWSTHAVGFSRPVVWEILTTYHNVSTQMFDNWLGEYIHPVKKCFMTIPIIAIQRPGFSDIWQQEVDYTGVFKKVNKLVK